MTSDSWRGLRAGDQIGNLEYVVDERALAEYRQVVGAGGCYPNLMAEDCRAMLAKRGPGEPLTTVWQSLGFLRPPIPGRRVQAGGWVREIGTQCGRRWIRVAAFAVDEIGTEILRSESAFAVGQDAVRRDAGLEPAETELRTVKLSGSRAGDGGLLGQLRMPSLQQMNGFRDVAKGMAGADVGADGNGFTPVLAGWLEGLVGASFGEDFRWGGRLSIAYHLAVTPSTQLRCDGVVIGHDLDVNGVENRRVVMTVTDAAGYRVATAEAVVKSPSPLLT